MNTLEITIQRKMDDSWPVVMEQSTPGMFLPVRSEGLLQIDPVLLQSQPTPKDYGMVLGTALFQEETRDRFMRALAESHDDLRILLFVEAPDLRTLRWERLCAPLGGGWDFLALNARAPFSLYLPSLTDRRFPLIGRRDLRALLVAASPNGLSRYDLQPFAAERVIAGLRVALGEIPYDVLATVDGAVGPPTLDALCERIMAERYTLLHIVCHGRYKRSSEETVLYLASATGGVDAVDSSRLLQRLRRIHGTRGLPHFTFLATCESASPSAEGALGGLAQRLVRDLGMPAVIAMTEQVTVETAQVLAEGFYHHLAAYGEVDRALVETSAKLADRYDIIVPVLYSRLGGRPLFSDSLDRALTKEEIAFGLAKLETLVAQRAPVLQQPFRQQAEILRAFTGVGLAVLSKAEGAAQEQALVEVNKLCEEVLELSFHALAIGQEVLPYDDRCPFCGLYPFREKDHEFFFGRDEVVAQLRDKLDWNNGLRGGGGGFLAVLGPSGSGKSSVVLAGLIPLLRGRDHELQMTYMRPGSDPTGSLDVAMAGTEASHVILVVDQFEELFTLCDDEVRRRIFVERLVQVADRLPVIVTMRADFWGECAPYPRLKGMMQEKQELLAPMTTAELRRTMEMQASSVGLRFEANLSNAILDDVAGEPGAMPLLQHALLELWRRRHGRWLRAVEYQAIGHVQQAISRTADNVYRRLERAEQEQMRDIFIRLTRLEVDGVPSQEQRDTRLRVWLEDLVPVGTDPAQTRALVKRLGDARLLVTSLNEVTGGEQVEVAHEALIRHWPRLRRWLDEDRETFRLRQAIGQAAKDWELHGRDKSYLYRGARLAQMRERLAQRQLHLNEREQTFLQTSTRIEARSRLIGIAAIVAGTALIATIATLAATGNLNRLLYRPLPIDWIEISAGEFTMGSGEAQLNLARRLPTDLPGGANYLLDNEPAHTVFLDTYEIGRYEVTNTQYRQCVRAGICAPPAIDAFDAPNMARLPVTGVSWLHARTFCEWTGARLPTEAEWEKAARGPNDWLYPWGDAFDLSKAHVDRIEAREPLAVGSFSPAGDSPYGLADMAGNVWEWVSDYYADSYYDRSPVNNPQGPEQGSSRTIRGGSFTSDWVQARSTHREPSNPGSADFDVGFRCAR